MLKTEDQAQIAKQGVSMSAIETQLHYFKNGFTPTPLHAPALAGSGITILSEKQIDTAISQYDQLVTGKRLVKFVPASGAATRMFKQLFEFAEAEVPSDAKWTEIIANQKSGSMGEFFAHIQKFAFIDDLKKSFEVQLGNLVLPVQPAQAVSIVNTLLGESGLNYGNLPKGLLKFHQYRNGEARTPAAEHLSEGCQYAQTGGKVAIHFTVSPEHLPKFQAHIAEIKPVFKQKYGCKIDVTYSIQKPSTDTIAVDMQNQPFRNADGSLLFRPAGHGALLENLNDIDADIIFLKNIDNVVPDHLKPETVKYKKALAALLLEVQKETFQLLQTLESNTSEAVLQQARSFISEKLGYQPDASIDAEEIRRILNRPIRVCGMVKSEGDPGGGPFWVKEKSGHSLQVVETAQINLDDHDQKAIFSRSTHFNPVDLVCGVRDYQGKKFDLLQFRDPSAGFITKKSKDGKDLKAQELPGLWNGSMAYWNTLFVEVPLITFNPVKTVNDLLKPEHQ